MGLGAATWVDECVCVCGGVCFLAFECVEQHVLEATVRRVIRVTCEYSRFLKNEMEHIDM